jgi:hypothetical protein
MKRLSGKRVSPTRVDLGGTRYEGCPAWVPGAIDRCVGARLVPRPVEIIWHPRQTSTRWGTCWPQEGRIHVYPWSGLRDEVDEDISVDVSGELSRVSISSRRVPGAQLEADLQDTLAHELAHLVHLRHDAAHRDLTARLLLIVKAAQA